MPSAASGPAPKSVMKKPIPWFKPARAAPSTFRQCINSMIVLPILIPLIFVRGPDVLYFDDIWCNRAGGPMPIFMATISVALALLKLASRRPGQALVITVALFAWVKQLADGSVPPPAVPGHYSGAVSPMTVLVTGANSGVGYAVALELARSGHTVLLACRSTAKCDAAREKLLLTLGDEMVGRHTFSRPDMVQLLEEEAARQLLHGEWSTNEQWEAVEETDEDEYDQGEEDDEDDVDGEDSEEEVDEGEEKDEFAEQLVKKKTSSSSSRSSRRKVPPDHRTKTWLAKQARLLNKSRQASQAASERIVSLGGMDLASVKGMDAFAAGPVAQAVRSAAASAPSDSNSNNKSKTRSKGQIDLLVLNAGYVPMPSPSPCVGGGGWECGLGDMHLGHFTFVQRLAAEGLITRGGGGNDRDTRAPSPVSSNAVQSSGTTCLVVASDIARLGGFHSSLLGALAPAPDPHHQGARTAPANAVNAGGEGDLRSEVTVGAGPYSLSRAPGILNAWALLPDHVSGGAYARAKLANVLFARELERRSIVQSAVSVHPGTVYTDIVNLDGVLGALQRAISPLLLRTPQASANVVLSSVYGPQGVKAYGDAKREASAAEIAYNAAKAAAVSARQRVAAGSSPSHSNGEASEDVHAAAKEAAAQARAAYEAWQSLENSLPPAVRASKVSSAAVASAAAAQGTTSMANSARTTLMQTPAAAVAAESGDPWLHFANGRGQVLGPLALAMKSTSRTDQLARALWAASEFALRRELGAS